MMLEYVKTSTLAFGLLILLSACAHQPQRSSVENRKISSPSAQFICRDGIKFSITFQKNDDTAHLIFSGHSTPEILENQHIVSGVEYSNDNYVFTEHRGEADLIDLTQDDDQKTRCWKIKKK